MAESFQDAEYVRKLNAALLKDDFDLNVNFREDRLCPPVRQLALQHTLKSSITQNRLKYVEWITQVAMAGCPSSGLTSGLDIGTGSVAIYPLLACQIFPNLTFVATELDPVSSSHARTIVEANGLRDRIGVVDGEHDSFFRRPADEVAKKKMRMEMERVETRFDFSMCNPPFILVWRRCSVSTAASMELFTEGGECSFVRNMVTESWKNPDLVRWYSTLLGFFASVERILSLFKDLAITNYTVGEIAAGRTKRWVIAWSLHPWRVPQVNLLAHPTPQPPNKQSKEKTGPRLHPIHPPPPSALLLRTSRRAPPFQSQSQSSSHRSRPKGFSCARMSSSDHDRLLAPPNDPHLAHAPSSPPFQTQDEDDLHPPHRRRLLVATSTASVEERGNA
ncbi:hypothetical protein BT69DRAFT_1336701 [Atractiella rhizophila]|nr:hypothetical protein BT69DRAFT_1336701 [Atractiella rhizophila]